jgi:hypothetical protein
MEPDKNKTIKHNGQNYETAPDTDKKDGLKCFKNKPAILITPPLLTIARQLN